MGPMSIKPIRTQAENKDALAEISKLMAHDPAIGTPACDRLNVLVNLVQAFEARQFRLGSAGNQGTQARRGVAGRRPV